MKSWSITIVLGLLGTLLHGDPALVGCTGSDLQTQFFAKGTVVRWDLSPTGLLEVYYSEAGHAPDHVTLHRVVYEGFDSSTEEELRESFGPQISILQSDEPGTGAHYYYIYLTNALYYGEKLDTLGFATTVWEDQEEDGLNGNECRVRH